MCIWNPARIIGQKGSKDGSSPAAAGGALLARLQKHSGPVRGLEFNPFAPNLLASGGADGDLCIWDVGTPSQPSLYPPMKGGGGDEVAALAWNRKVRACAAACRLRCLAWWGGAGEVSPARARRWRGAAGRPGAAGRVRGRRAELRLGGRELLERPTRRV